MDPRLAALTPEDQRLVFVLATLMLDTAEAYGDACAEFLTERKLKNLPNDDEMKRGLAVHATADAREVLVTLRTGMDPSGHLPPVEAVKHARYLRERGIGLRTLISIYQYGFAMFRDLLGLELQSRTSDPAQLSRIQAATDAYAFPFIGVTMQRLAYEYGSTEPAWTPTATDEVLGDNDSFVEAKRLRDESIAKNTWVAATPDDAGARRGAEQALDTFTSTLASGVRDKGLHDRLALASTRIAITLSDEPDVSATLLLDRSPIEVVDGVGDAESQIWIASIDLARLWSPEYYLPMAIAKGRVRMVGPVRKFLRILPILRTAGEAPDSSVTPESY